MIFTESFVCNHLLELADRIPVGGPAHCKHCVCNQGEVPTISNQHLALPSQLPRGPRSITVNSLV